MSSAKVRLGNRLILLIALPALLGLTSGCGGDGTPSLYPVTGTVKRGDEVMTTGWVTLVPDKKKGNEFKGEPRGQIDSSGKYTISTNGKPGAPLGAYKVTVGEGGTAPPDNTKIEKTKPEKLTYLNPEITPLQFEVVKEPAAGAYDLKLSP